MTEQEWLASEDPRAMLGIATGLRVKSGPGWEWRYRTSDRKLRLFAVALWRLRDAGRSTHPVDVERVRIAESIADGADSVRSEYAILESSGAAAARRMVENPFAEWEDRDGLCNMLRDIVVNPFRPVTLPTHQTMDQVCVECGRRWGVGTSMCGDFACPGRVRPFVEWLTPEVVSIARAAYDERNPDGRLDNARLAVLSDALEEAGCPHEERCRCVRSWDGEWSSLESSELGLYGGAVKVAKRCPDCRESGAVPHPILAHLRSPGPHYRGMWSLDLILGKE